MCYFLINQNQNEPIVFFKLNHEWKKIPNKNVTTVIIIYANII